MKRITIKPLRHLDLIFISLLFFLIAPSVYVYGVIENGETEFPLILIILWIGLSVFYGIGFILHIIYYLYDREKEIIIENETITVLRKGEKINEFKINDVKQIVNINSKQTRAPWQYYEYYLFQLNNGENCTLTCLLIDRKTINEIFRNNLIIEDKYLAAFLDERKRYLRKKE